MSNEELRAQARTSAPQIKIASGIWVVGMMIIAAVTIVGALRWQSNRLWDMLSS